MTAIQGLVLKSVRRTEAHRVPTHEAQGMRRRRTHQGCGAHFYAKFFWSISYFTKHVLHKQVKINALTMWLDINMTSNTANNLKICYLIIVVPQCMYLQY